MAAQPIHHHPDHRHGTCYVNDRYCWVNIPKNASCTLKAVLERFYGFRLADFHHTDVSGLTTFCVLRDPLDRFISAVAEWHHTGRQAKIQHYVDHLGTPYLDSHFERQSWFIDGVEIDRFIWIGELQYWMHRMGLGRPLPYLRQSGKAQKREVIGSITLDLAKRIDEYYRPDYNLIAEVK